MPTVRVPEYGAQKVDVNALPNSRRTVAPTAEALGSEAGDKINKVGLHIYEDEMLRQDQVATLEADRRLSEWENRALYDPKDGALNKRGKDAFGLPDAVGADYQKFVDETRTVLTTDRQRVAFDRAVEARRKDLNGTLSRHVMTEVRKFDDSESTAAIQASRQAAVFNFQDDDRITLEIERQRANVVDYAARNGLGAEYVKARLGTELGATHEAVITRMLANGMDQSAQKYYEKNKADITDGKTLSDIEAKIKTSVVEGEGMRSADETWKKLGPTSDLAPVNLDKMLEDLKSRHADNPLVLKNAIQHLKERASIHNASQRERTDATESAVWQAVSKGASLNSVRSMPEYLALPGRQQEQVRNYVVDEAFQRSQRARTLSNQAEDDLARKNFARYAEISDPDVLKNMTRDQIINETPKLGRTLTERLLTRKDSFDKSADAVRAATIDNDQFNTIAKNAGFDPFKKKPTEEDKAKIGELRDFVERAIDVEQKTKGKALTRGEKGDLMQRLVDQKVMIDEWGRDPERLAGLVKPEDRAAAYVPIAKVPKDYQSQAANWLRSTGKVGQSMSDEAITSRFRARIERAYAQRLLGGTREDIEKILKGQ